MTFFVAALFIYDIYALSIGEVPFFDGIIATLGSLLILWAVSELIGEQIDRLKKREGFAIRGFIGVALAAMIRKILIASLSSEKIAELLSYGVIILALGVVYWLTSRR